MPISRPLVVALIAAVFLFVVVIVMNTLGGGEPPPPPSAGVTPGAPPAGTPPAPGEPERQAKPEAPRGGDTDVARPRDPDAAEAAREALPPRIERALRRGRTIVIMFRQRGAGDDAAVRRAVRALRRTRAAVFVEPVSRIGRYRRLVSGLGVAQAPATIVVGDRGARLVEGYVDAATLRQMMVDLRR